MRFDVQRDVATRDTMVRGRISDREVASVLNAEILVPMIVRHVVEKIGDDLYERLKPGFDKLIGDEFSGKTKTEAPTNVDAP